MFGRVKGPGRSRSGRRTAGCASWAQYFLKWILAQPAVTCVIPGTRNPRHVADNLGALAGPLPDAAMRRRMARALQLAVGADQQEAPCRATRPDVSSHRGAAGGRLAGRRDPRRQRGRRARRRGDRGDPPGLLDHLVIFFRDQKLTPARAARLREALRRADGVPAAQGPAGVPADHPGGQARGRADQLRRGVAFGHDLPRRSRRWPACSTRWRSRPTGATRSSPTSTRLRDAVGRAAAHARRADRASTPRPRRTRRRRARTG